MTRDEVEKLLIQFRAKCSELNLINEEMRAREARRDELYQAYKDRYDEYLHYAAEEVNQTQRQLMEIRSELQALQATLLDVMIEEWIRQ